MEPNSNETVVSLTTINQGAAVELFNQELRKVLENIADPNTSAKVRREIVLKVSIIPNEERKAGGVLIDCRSKLAQHRGTTTLIWFGQQNGQHFAVEANPNQGNLFDKPTKPVSPVSSIRKESV